MPGPPPPPPIGGLFGGPPVSLGGPPPPPPPMNNILAPQSGREALLTSITDPSARKLKKVDPKLIKDRSGASIPGAGNATPFNSISSNNEQNDSTAIPKNVPILGNDLNSQLLAKINSRNKKPTEDGNLINSALSSTRTLEINKLSNQIAKSEVSIQQKGQPNQEPITSSGGTTNKSVTLLNGSNSGDSSRPLPLLPTTNPPQKLTPPMPPLLKQPAPQVPASLTWSTCSPPPIPPVPPPQIIPPSNRGALHPPPPPPPPPAVALSNRQAPLTCQNSVNDTPISRITRPAPPPPSKPPSLTDEFESRFSFNHLPHVADLPKTFNPPPQRVYPSHRFVEKLKLNQNI